MLDLGSDRWATLSDAYGSASSIPDLVRAAINHPAPTESAAEEPWFSLWSALCHQDSISDASFAAVPHLLDTAAGAGEPYAWDFLALPAAIEAIRLSDDGAPHIPEDLAAAYLESWRRMPGIIDRASAWPWDHVFAQAVAGALAASKGQGLLARAILEMGPKTSRRFLELVEEGEV